MSPVVFFRPPPGYHAEIKLGELLAVTERHPPGPEKQDRSSVVTDPPPSLSDIGITKNASSKAQALARMTENRNIFRTNHPGYLTQVKTPASP